MFDNLILLKLGEILLGERWLSRIEWRLHLSKHLDGVFDCPAMPHHLDYRVHETVELVRLVR